MVQEMFIFRVGMFQPTLLKVGDRIKTIERLADSDELLNICSDAVPTDEGSAASL